MLRAVMMDAPQTRAMIAAALEIADSTANNWIIKHRNNIRVVGWMPSKFIMVPLYKWEQGEDVPRPEPKSKRSQKRKAEERSVAKKATKHKNFHGGEWDKTLFDMSQYQPRANWFDAWLFDSRMAA